MADAKKVFVGGLSPDTDEATFKDYFSQFGVVEEALIMRDGLTGNCRGFGFITWTEVGPAGKAMETPRHTLAGKSVEVKSAVPRGAQQTRPTAYQGGNGGSLGPGGYGGGGGGGPPQQQQSSGSKIFVGGIAHEASEDEFRAYFEQYGPVKESMIMKDGLTGKSRGFGFVTFEDESAVPKALAVNPNHQLAGKKMEVKFATPRGSGPQGRGAPPGGGGGGYGAPGGYGQGGGYGAPGGYGQGGYGAPMGGGYGGGYGAPGGYAQAGYGAPMGYGAPGGYAQAGYGAPGGYGAAQGGAYGAPAAYGGAAAAGGYGAPAAAAGGYGAPAADPYGQAGAAQQQQGGYGAQAAAPAAAAGYGTGYPQPQATDGARYAPY